MSDSGPAVPPFTVTFLKCVTFYPSVSADVRSGSGEGEVGSDIWDCFDGRQHLIWVVGRVGFYGLRGLSIGVMVFILYKLYVLLPYTYPTPKLSPHRRRCISIFPQKNSLCMIYKHFKLWGHWKCPHKSPSPCNTYVIPMSLYKFVSS